MQLNELHIQNFRCFSDYRITFASGLTVLFGKNGTGKTTLIHAIHKALSFAFKRDKEEKALNLGAGFPDLKPRDYSKTEDLTRDPKTGMPFSFINIHACATFEGVPLDWDMYASTSTFKVQPSKFGVASMRLKNRIKETDQLPMFAYFSDGFPHVTKETKLSEKEMSLRNLGYLGWDEETAYSDIWINRLTMIWTLWDRANRTVDGEKKALENCEYTKAQGKVNEEEYNEDIKLHKSRLENAEREKSRYDDEVQAIRNCLIKFSQGDKNIEVTDFFVSVYEESGLCLQTRDGSNPSFIKLPAGYKRLFFMVLDIAYRSLLLSNGSTTDLAGIVMIDEIDLHLHPELEQSVLARFRKTFPRVQFIISTHSPLVLSGVENKPENIVYSMHVDDGMRTLSVHRTYGIDANSLMAENMEAANRTSAVMEQIRAIEDCVSGKDLKKAKALLSELEKETEPTQPELVRLRAIIKRLEIIGR